MDGDNTTSWSDLPADLVTAIANKLTELADLACFRSVCPSWRSASAAHAARLRVPLLLLPTEGYDTRVNRRVWSVADDRLREIPLPAALGHAFLFASHHGWMLAVAGDLTTTLVYPFTGGSAGLPALPPSFRGDSEEMETLRDLAWDWSPRGVVVSPGKREGAFFCRPGDGSWRPVGCSSGGVTSVTYCDGAFYLFEGNTCKATVVDAETLAVAAVIQPPALEIPSWRREANLVVSSPDELLLLVRTRLLHSGWIAWENIVKVFRANRAAGDRSPSWTEVVAGIGDRAVFVDHLRAFCVEANALNGLRGNCIYVASSYEEVNDDYGMEINGRYTVAVLDIADLTTVDLSFGKLLSVCCSRFWQWPSWSLPNLR